MKAQNAAQLALFFLVLALFGVILWDSVTKTAAVLGVIGGLLIHYGITNKGNKAIVNIKPLSGGFRVLIYDMLLVAALATIYEAAGNLSAFLGTLASMNANTAVLAAIVVGLVTDYFATG